MSDEAGLAPQRPDLDAAAICEVLNRHQVAYVVVGGFADELHGSTRHRRQRGDERPHQR